MSNLRTISLECALVIVPAMAAGQSPFAGMMKAQIEGQVREWYAQGVSLQVDITQPLGKQRVKQGWIKP